MFTRISKTLLHARLQSQKCSTVPRRCSLMFSTQKDVNRLRETARIADHVIRMIRSPFEVSELEKEAWSHESPEQQIERVKSYALAERIKDALMKLNTHQHSRDDVLELFTTGIEPPASIFHQMRIQDAKINSKLIYCPNSIISRQIFSIMGPNMKGQLYRDSKKFVLTGYKGISKTLSVSLLWHLVRLIDEYRFSEQGIQEEAKEKKFNHPKIVYWSIKQDDTLQQVYDQLLQQLPELKRCYTSKELIQKQIHIGKFYRNNYGKDITFIVDQINYLASQLRKLSERKKLYINSKQKAQNKEATSSWSESWSDEEEKELSKVQSHMKLVKKIALKFDKTIYLSPKDIETGFIRKCDLATNCGHTIVPVYQIKYAEQIYKQSSLIDLCHFFIFEFNQKVIKEHNITVPKEELMKAQKMCVQHLKQRLRKKKYFFTTFFNIFGQVSNLTNLSKVSFNQATDFKVYLLEKFTTFIEKTTSDVIRQFYGHFLKNDKNDQARKNLTLNLSEEIFHMIKSKHSPSQNGEVSIPLQRLNLDQQTAHDILPLTFFSYRNEDPVVTLRLPAQLTYQILEPKVADWLSFYLKEKNSWMKKSSTSVGLAITIQRLFVLALKRGDIQFKMSYQKQQAPGIVLRTSIEYNKIRKGSYPFIPLNTKGPHSLLSLLNASLNEMLDKDLRCAVLEPVTGKIAQKDFVNVEPHRLHETSKGIDLILAQIFDIMGFKRISLNIIDVTVSKSESLVEAKMKSFLDIILELKDKNTTQYEYKLNFKPLSIPVMMSYFIFCQKNLEEGLLDKLSKDQKYGKEFIFTGSDRVNCFGISFKDNKKSLLIQVGFINIEQDIQLIHEEEGAKDVLSFKEALRVLNKKREQQILAQMEFKRQTQESKN